VSSFKEFWILGTGLEHCFVGLTRLRSQHQSQRAVTVPITNEDSLSKSTAESPLLFELAQVVPKCDSATKDLDLQEPAWERRSGLSGGVMRWFLYAESFRIPSITDGKHSGQMPWLNSASE
jgi:hypothetical protein